MAIKATKQQKKILVFMANQTGLRSWKEMGREIEGMNANTFRAQLTNLATMGLARPESETENLKWILTKEGVALARQIKGEKPAADPKAVHTPPGPAGAPHLASSEKIAPPPAVIEEAPGSEVTPPIQQEPPKHLTMHEAGLTERQIFEQKGYVIGAIPPDKLAVIADMVWSRDPHNLDWVWEALGSTNVPIDIARFWWHSWKAYLSRSASPPIVSPELDAALTAPKERTTQQIQQAAKEARDYIIEDDEIIKVQPGRGTYTMQDAKDVLDMQLRSKKAMSGAEMAPLDGLSTLITALAPFLKPSGDQNNLPALITALSPFLKPDTDKELLESKLKNMALEIKAGMPAQQGMTDQVGGFIALIKALGEAGPIIRSVLGIPDQAQSHSPAYQPITLRDAEGNPMQIDLNSLLQVKKFEAEQRREDESAKAKQEFGATVRGFVDRLGKAVERTATP